MADSMDLSKIRVTIPKIGTVLFPPELDPIQVDQEARKLYMKAGAGRLPIVPTVKGQGQWLYGMQQPGNIDLTKRPTIQTREGPATVRSAGFGIDGKEVLLPTVGNGQEWSDDEAVAEYRRTGKHLGIFQNPQGSTEYGQELHKAYESGQIPSQIQQPQPQMGPPAPLPERYMSRMPQPSRDVGSALRNVRLPVQTGGFDESTFQKWYRGWASKAGIDPNPDDPLHKYDYRAAYRAGAEPQINPEDKSYHWDSKFKAWDHPNRYVDGIDTITGLPAPFAGGPPPEGPPLPDRQISRMPERKDDIGGMLRNVIMRGPIAGAVQTAAEQPTSVYEFLNGQLIPRFTP